MKRRAAILFDHFGPYHLARLRAAADVCDLLAVEFGSSSDEYAWRRESWSGFHSKTLCVKGPSSRMSHSFFKSELGEALSRFEPEVVFVPGWSSRGALYSLEWCLLHRIPAVVMSESTPWDAPRSPLGESVKSRLIKLFSSALVGGRSHSSYLQRLGMDDSRIFSGYDAVDNAHFLSANPFSGESSPLISRSFLASARFLPKKNLPLLLEAFALYRRSLTSRGHSPWNLILLGDGPLKGLLQEKALHLGLGDSFLMPGFVQYPDLPNWYSKASCFVHASTTEQWGLVVNEAMASGLPVLVSNRCGCAADLVKEGFNGWTFDPDNVTALATMMERISLGGFDLSTMGNRSREIISLWGPERFAKGVESCIRVAMEGSLSGRDLTGKTLLRILNHLRRP